MAIEQLSDDLKSLNSNPLLRAELDLIPISQEPLLRGNFLFPRLSIPVSNVRFRVIDFNQARRLILETLRALDAKAKEIRTETALEEVGVDEYMLKTLVDARKVREARSLGTRYIAEQLAVIRELMVIGHEYRLMAIAASPSNYTLSHKASGFDAKAPGLYDDFMAFIDVISASVGRPPNRLLIGRAFKRKLKTNPEIIARYSTPLGGGVKIDNAVIADYLEIPQVEDAQGGYVDDNDVFVPFLDDAAVLAYVDPRRVALDNMSYGSDVYQTYDGVAFDTRQTPPMGVEEMIEAGCCEIHRPALTNQDAGFLVTG